MSVPASERMFLAFAALLFVASAALTTAWCTSMSAMGGMPMPGGWTMSMAWMRMPGQTWPGAAASFLAMWIVMMVAMMLPALVPMLLRYRRAVGAAGAVGETRAVGATGASGGAGARGAAGAIGATGASGEAGAKRLARLTVFVGAGYFFVWAVVGIVAFAVGVALATMAMQVPALARAVPVMAGLVVLLAGALQFTRWKARHLAHCRNAPACALSSRVDARAAWRHGVRLGLHCAQCCAGLMAILLVIGVMDLRAMAIVTAAIVTERVAPSGERTARAIGVAIAAGGLLLIARAAAW